MKLKYIVPFIGLFLVFLSCNKDDNNTIPFDAEAQAKIDDDTLLEYLKSHYYIPALQDEPFGHIDTIMNNEASLFSLIGIQKIEQNDIDYNLYFLNVKDGSNNAPTETDSVLVNYRGFLLDSVKFDERINYTWLPLTNVIRGWSYGFTNFKDGDNISEPGEPLDFENTGEGILFIPSGLSYGNIGTSGIGPNEPLIFHIRLGLVIRADHDNDSILSNFEDIDKDGNPNNDDTDGDNIADYQDIDDDGDGTLTKDENPDPNNDGDPTDAKDTDGDGTPDYLDPDTN